MLKKGPSRSEGYPPLAGDLHGARSTGEDKGLRTPVCPLCQGRERGAFTDGKDKAGPVQGFLGEEEWYSQNLTDR